MLAEAAELAVDVRRIWDAPTTTSRDRKELIRIMVRSAFLEDQNDERLRVRIRRADGAPDGITNVWLQDGVARLMNELAGAGKNWAEIAEELNGMGLKTRRGNRFTVKRGAELVEEV